MQLTITNVAAQVAASKVAVLTAQAKLIADQLGDAKAMFIATGVAEVTLPDGTKVSAIESATREFDHDILKSILTAEAWSMVTKESVSAAQFDAADKLGKVPSAAQAAITFVPRTIVKVNSPRA